MYILGGSNSYGEVGSGDYNSKATPRKIEGFKNETIKLTCAGYLISLYGCTRELFICCITKYIT